MTNEEIIEFLETRLAEVVKSRDFTREWYGARFERLKDLCKKHGCWDEAAAIIANGSLIHERDSYAGIINAYRHRAEGTVEALDNLVRALDNHIDEFYGPAHDDKNLQWRLNDARRALKWYRTTGTKDEESGSLQP